MSTQSESKEVEKPPNMVKFKILVTPIDSHLKASCYSTSNGPLVMEYTFELPEDPGDDLKELQKLIEIKRLIVLE
jgi:hypothetical protein